MTDETIKKAKDIRDQITYGIGMTAERHTEILMDIGERFIVLSLECESEITREIKMHEYIKNKYINTNELIQASIFHGRVFADESLQKSFTIKYARKIALGEK